MTITEFLTARYDEDEERASSGWSSLRDERWERIDEGNSVMTPRGVLADIAAKRAIVAMHGTQGTYDGKQECDQCSFHELYEGFNDVSEPWPCPTMRLLALPYAEHADFDEGWRV